MRNRRSATTLALLATIALVGGCDNSNDTQPTHLLTLEVDATFNTTVDDNWIIVHDEQGHVLDYSAFEAGNTIQLEATGPVPGTIGFTLLRYYYNQATGVSSSLTTVLDVQPGRTIKLKYLWGGPPALTSVGPYTINITGNTRLEQFSASNKYNGTCGVTGSLTDTYSKLTIGCNETKETSRVLVQASTRDGVLGYTWVEGKKDQTYNLAFEDLDRFDKEVEFKFHKPGRVSAIVDGNEPGMPLGTHGYLINFNITSIADVSFYKVGYLNALTNYYTYVTAMQETYSLTYAAYNHVPASVITWPQPTEFKVTSTGLDNFTCSATTPFVSRQSIWTYYSTSGTDTYVEWTIHTEKNTNREPMLPQELVDKYPALGNNMVYSHTTFNISAPSYNAWLDDQYTNGGLTKGEYISLSLYK